MKNFGFLAFGALALAAPLEKRKVLYHTVVEEVYETVYTTTTVWAGHVASTTAQAASVNSSIAAAVVPTTTSTETPIAAATTSVAAAVSSAADTPAVAAVTTPATVNTPTTTAEAASVAAATTVATTSASSSSSTGTHTGDITYYDVSAGLGSCGTTATNDEAVVALSYLDMDNGANPNDNPLCGTYINIFYNGETHTARIFDTCPSCAEGSLDLSPSLFTAVAPDGNGRVHDVSWSFA